MRDIKQAIQEEEKYLINREINKNISLIDNIKYCGYNNLNDYFEDKREYLIHTCNMNFISLSSPVQTIPAMQEAFTNNRNSYIELGDVEPILIWKGTDTLNEQACIDDNVSVYELGYTGGTIVTGVNDYNFMIVIDKSIDANGAYFLNRLYEYISQYENNVTVDNNDILIDGKKVIGAAHIDAGNMEVYTTQATFVDRSELVKRYCNVPSAKSPGIFKVLTKEQLRSEVLSWLLQY